MKTPSRVAAFGASVLLAASLAACGGGDDGDVIEGPEETPTMGPQDGTEGTDGATTAETVTVATTESDLGTILVDDEGRTLYIFTADEPGVSNCGEGCETAWPPVLAEPEAGEGVDASLLGTIERAESGAIQATINDRPLYYFARDVEPGDTTGQGVGDQWWVVSPEGEPIGADGQTGTDENSGGGM